MSSEMWLTLAGVLTAGLMSGLLSAWQINRNQRLSLRKEHIALDVARMAGLLARSRAQALVRDDRAEAAKLVGCTPGTKHLVEKLEAVLGEHIRAMVSATVFASRRGLRNHIDFHNDLSLQSTGKKQPPLDTSEWEFFTKRVRGMRKEAGQSCWRVNNEELCRLWVHESSDVPQLQRTERPPSHR